MGSLKSAYLSTTAQLGIPVARMFVNSQRKEAAGESAYYGSVEKMLFFLVSCQEGPCMRAVGTARQMNNEISGGNSC